MIEYFVDMALLSTQGYRHQPIQFHFHGGGSIYYHYQFEQVFECSLLTIFTQGSFLYPGTHSTVEQNYPERERL